MAFSHRVSITESATLCKSDDKLFQVTSPEKSMNFAIVLRLSYRDSSDLCVLFVCIMLSVAGVVGPVSQAGSSPVPWVCLVSSAWQQATCGSGGVSLCHGETVQCRVPLRHSHSAAAVSQISRWTCWHHREMDQHCSGNEAIVC